MFRSQVYNLYLFKLLETAYNLGNLHTTEMFRIQNILVGNVNGN